MPQDGLITLSSRYPARDTVQRLLAALAKRNMAVFARIDHAAGAASAGAVEAMGKALAAIGAEVTT